MNTRIVVAVCHFPIKNDLINAFAAVICLDKDLTVFSPAFWAQAKISDHFFSIIQTHLHILSQRPPAGFADLFPICNHLKDSIQQSVVQFLRPTQLRG